MSEPGSATETTTERHGHGGIDELRAELARAQRLDRDLAGDMGRHAPVRNAVAVAFGGRFGRRSRL